MLGRRQLLMRGDVAGFVSPPSAACDALESQLAQEQAHSAGLQEQLEQVITHELPLQL